MIGKVEFIMWVRNTIRMYIYKYIAVRLRRFFYYIKYREAAPIRDEIIYVDPEKISKDCYMCVKKRRGYKYHIDKSESIILDGEWDREMRGFQEMGIEKYEKLHQALDRHFNEDLDWQSTELYNYLMENEVSDERYHNARQRFEEIDNLYNSMKIDGYKRQEWMNEIAVGIGRDGRICRIYDGTHRLRIAKILDVSEVPVRVAVRHKKWQKIRYELSKDDEREYQKETLSDHPDIQKLIN